MKLSTFQTRTTLSRSILAHQRLVGHRGDWSLLVDQDKHRYPFSPRNSFAAKVTHFDRNSSRKLDQMIISFATNRSGNLEIHLNTYSLVYDRNIAYTRDYLSEFRQVSEPVEIDSLNSQDDATLGASALRHRQSPVNFRRIECSPIDTNLETFSR